MTSLPTRRFEGWQTLLALVAVVAIDYVIGSNLTVELRSEVAAGEEVDLFLVEMALEAALLSPPLVFWLLGRLRWFRLATLVVTGVLTVSLFVNVFGLVLSLDNYSNGYELLWDAGLLWITNVLIFSVWYWLVDSGGPEVRLRGALGQASDFAFPQQTNQLPGWDRWRPGYLDYLFLAFSHSTAFSPTDTLILSRKAKLLIMVQASISLIVIAMIAARAINIIQSTSPGR